MASLGKKSNKEIISPDIVGVRSPEGPTKRMRKTMRKNIIEAPKVLDFATVDII